jgi:methionyl-tRNA formyltransferase
MVGARRFMASSTSILIISGFGLYLYNREKYNTMKIAFIGAGSIAEIALKAIASNFEIVAVLPQIDVPPEAIEGIKAFTIKNGKGFISSIDDLTLVDAELVVSCSFNRCLPEKILKRFKCINIHYGILPQYRGWHPINWAIINDEKQTGYTIHLMDEGIDSGPILFQRRIKLIDDDTAASLTEKLNLQLGEDLVHVLKNIKRIKPKKQTGRPLYCGFRTPEDGLIDWSLPSRSIFNLIRALSKPYPGAFAYLNSEKIVIELARLPPKDADYRGVPGSVVYIRRPNVLVATGDGAILVEKIRRGDKLVDATDVVSSIQARFKQQ